MIVRVRGIVIVRDMHIRGNNNSTTNEIRGNDYARDACIILTLSNNSILYAALGWLSVYRRKAAKRASKSSSAGEEIAAT